VTLTSQQRGREITDPMFSVGRLSGAPSEASGMVLATDPFALQFNRFRDLAVALRRVGLVDRCAHQSYRTLNQLRIYSTNPHCGHYGRGIRCGSINFPMAVQSQNEHQHRRVHL